MIFALDKEAAFTQKIEQPVPAYVMAVLRKLDLKLARAKARHVLADQPDLADDGGVVDLFRVGRALTLP